VFRATVKSSFAIRGRGTYLVVDLFEGVAKPGDMACLALPTGPMEFKVRGVEIIDWRGTSAAGETLLVEGVEPSDVPPGTAVSSP
jgi:hypothetical protein